MTESEVFDQLKSENKSENEADEMETQQKNESDEENEIKANVSSASEGEDEAEQEKRRKHKKQRQLIAKIKKEKAREREADLKQQIFGDKDKLLHNLEITAACGAKKKRKHADVKPVWQDSDDEEYTQVHVADAKTEQVVHAKQYKKQLENKLQRIVGTPRWAKLEQKARDADDSDDEILRTVGHLAHVKSERLVREQLKFKRLKDLNRSSYVEGPLIKCVQFHPTSTACLVAGTRGIATIFSIDGKQNDKLHSVQFDNFPIHCMRLTKDGNEAMFGSTQKYFYTYDLLGGKSQRVFLPRNITKARSFEISPCGKIIAIIGRFGEVHLLDSVTKETFCTLKQEHDVVSMTFTRDSKHLFTHSVDSEVHIFNVVEQRLEHRFTDDGCINGSCITLSPSGSLVAAGSAQGVVNVYNYHDAITQKLPQPVKTFMNLTTSISTVKFNHSSEMLAFASNQVADAVKIAHFPSATVFNNFPGNLPKLGRPQVLEFSPQSGFLAVAGHEKQVNLYRLNHFSNY